MTAFDLIDHLRRGHAFDPSPQPSDLALLHVQFDDLRGDERTEAALRKSALAIERVALVGAIGVGKSSVLSHVFALDSPFAPVVLSVAYERTEVVTDPGAFAGHAVQVILRYAEETELTAPDDRERYLRAVADRKVLPSTEKGIGGGVKLAPWIAELDLHGDLKRITPSAELHAPAVEHIAALEEMIRLVKQTDRLPVIVIDDSDRWLTVGPPTARAEVVEPFLTEVLRMLTERSIGFVVAMHDSYLELDAYARALDLGVVETVVDVPDVPSQEALEAILRHRVELQQGDASVEDVFDDGARAELWRVYEEAAARQLRKTLQVAHGALAEADFAGDVNRISRELIRTSAAAALA